ncbi:DUF523 and DUF1722 domain-containing protein [bacterium]|nr:DUF523 and DUF1722 domain-containing protein [bacterium]
MKNNNKKIPIAISGCLLGQNVRFNGGHKKNRYISDTLGGYFEWVTFCPEVAIGLGIPRNPIRLEKENGVVRLFDSITNETHTESMKMYGRKILEELTANPVYGYILKSKSPSCGIHNVNIQISKEGKINKNGMGIYTSVLKESLPNLPMEEEGRLSDAGIRENWIARVFAYYDFKSTVYPSPTIGKLVEFHSSAKFTVLSHCEKTYRILGRLVANADQKSALEVAAEYENLFMLALSKKTAPKKNLNVMLHLFGFFKNKLDSKSRSNLLETIEDYSKGTYPLVVPITLIHHYAKILDIKYLMNQSYLQPYPKTLSLRNNLVS